MNGINDSGTTPIQAVKEVNSEGSAIERIAKSRGVPDNVIAQGPAAIRAWAQENGIIPGSKGGETDPVASPDNRNPKTESTEESIPGRNLGVDIKA